MADMFDYLQWRGDILFSQLGVNPVDALIFSTLSYIRYEQIVPDTTKERILLKDAAAAILAQPEQEKLMRVDEDLKLLQAAAETARFGGIWLTFYRTVFDAEEDTQFAAITYLLDDGTAFLGFRGTDSTLVGWKEDFNMTFQESVPSQRLAREYVREFSMTGKAPLRLGGHSKGGNLAVYAGAKSTAAVRSRILEIYNQDGPGFTEHMMTDPGYLAIVPKIKTYVPQSSVFGMLLEHEEPYIIVRSKSIGLLQHDPYSWEVMGGNFILVKELTAESRFLDKTFKTWLAGMTNQERSEFFDSVFDLLMMENANHPRDIIRPQNLLTYFKTMHMDEDRRRMIASTLLELVESARNTHSELSEQ